MIITLGRYFFFLLLFLSLLLLQKGVTVGGEIDTLAFFRATENKTTYAKAPDRYERLVVRDAMGKREYYIERQPAHVIRRNALEKS